MKLYRRLYRILNRYRGIGEYTITYDEMKRINEKYSLIDVRSRQEYREGHLNKSINIPLFDIERGNYNFSSKDLLIILYCQSGTRSIKALQILRRKGYSRVYQLNGGLDNI